MMRYKNNNLLIAYFKNHCIIQTIVNFIDSIINHLIQTFIFILG